MHHRTSRTVARRRRAHPRRGVSSVLAMMFLVIFSSLAAAMAVVSQGNLRTADSHMKVSRAMSAAETGLVFAIRRLAAESSRFVVTKGVIDDTYGADLWDGGYPGDGSVEVLPPADYTEPSTPAGVVEAVRNAHLADSHTIEVEPGDSSYPAIDAFYTLRVKPIALTALANGNPNPDGPYFRLRYEVVEDPDAEATFVRVTSQGVDGDIQRTLQMDFRVDKKIEFAIISPSRIMIGKNVRVEGPLGSRYGLVAGELDGEHGDPMVIRSDFYYLDDDLDDNLDALYTEVVDHDVDGDNRLRLYHPAESVGIASNPGLFVDYDGDEYVDDFDLFMDFYDFNGDGWVVYDNGLTALAGLGSPAEEFDDIDDQLARLIDEAMPDRDADGFITPADTSLGYQDGVISSLDLYAKVRGRLTLSISRAEWEAAHGESYQTVVQGPVHPDIDEAPITFEASDDDMREVTTDMFDASFTWFEAQVPVGPADFVDQVNAGVAAGGTATPPGPTTWESIPFGAQGAYDYYQRPIFEDMTFTNVRIPMGTNGLFQNCTFIGVTFIETEPDCVHENWNYAGAVERVEDPPGSGNFVYEPKYPGVVAQLAGADVADTKPLSNNTRFDNCTFIGSISGTKPNEYTHWRNKIQLTGETRFYIYDDDPELLAEDDPVFINFVQATINGMTDDTLEELRKSSILMPGWSADMGNFTNEQAVDPADTPKVQLKGTIVAGVLDVRGTADVYGTLLMTYRPAADEGPLFYGGLTDAFNATIGYFGPSDGDGEGVDPDAAAFTGFGEITLRYDQGSKLPDGIPWPIQIAPTATTYREGGSM